MKNSINVVAAVCLTLGGVFGLLETVFSQGNLQATSWGIDGLAPVVATVLLALKFSRGGNDFVAAGFLEFANGEGVLLSGTMTTLAESVPSFAAGTDLWPAALLLTSVPREFARWIRVTSMIGSILFAITTARIFWGQQIFATASPPPFFAYPFLFLTFGGWVWTLMKTA